MVWNDVYIIKNICLSKFFYCVIASIVFITILIAIRSMMIHTGLENTIIAIAGIVSCTYFSAYNLFIILKGGRYVKSIQKAGEQFVLVNIFNEEIVFKLSDVSSVKPSKYSRFETLLTDFGGKNPGFSLFLKNRRKYRITSDMENIDTLRDHLLGNVEY
jgi:hypothetical protein